MRGPHWHTIRDALVIAQENAPTAEYAARFSTALAACDDFDQSPGSAAPRPVTTTWLRSQVMSALGQWLELTSESPGTQLINEAVDAVMAVLEPALGRITAETAALVRAELVSGAAGEVLVNRQDLHDALTMLALHAPLLSKTSGVVDRLSAAVGDAE